jgi:hypothetical protein
MQGGDVPFHCIPEGQALAPLRSLSLFCSSTTLDPNALRIVVKKRLSAALSNFATGLVGNVGFPTRACRSLV